MSHLIVLTFDNVEAGRVRKTLHHTSLPTETEESLREILSKRKKESSWRLLDQTDRE